MNIKTTIKKTTKIYAEGTDGSGGVWLEWEPGQATLHVSAMFGDLTRDRVYDLISVLQIAVEELK